MELSYVLVQDSLIGCGMDEVKGRRASRTSKLKSSTRIDATGCYLTSLKTEYGRQLALDSPISPHQTGLSDRAALQSGSTAKAGKQERGRK